MPDRPIEILALPTKLHELFDGRVAPKAGPDAEQNERDFLSRALAAYALHKLGGVTLDEAASSIVDGGGDGGIDSVYFSRLSNTLWLTQAKYVHTGMNEPELGDVSKFKEGVENMLRGNFDAFRNNPQLLELQPKLESWLANPSTQVRAVLCYSGLRLISEDRKRLFEQLRATFNHTPADDYFGFQSVNLTTLNDWVTGGDVSVGIDSVELEILYPGFVAEPYELIYGLVPVERLKDLQSEYGAKLIRANIRGFKGSTDVNDEIQDTLRKHASLFHYLNNGLTAYCDRLELNNLDRVDARRKRITARGFAIINGAQTLGSIAKVVSAPETEQEYSGFAFIKIVSLEKCDDERAFAERISHAANFQNHISLKDFAAAYPLHEQMQLTLQPHGIGYHYRLDEDTPKSDEENFDIEEALTACACLHTASDCDLLYRVAANRESLRSLEMVFPPEEAVRTRHERVFPEGLSARSAWRAVQVQRLVLDSMRSSARASMGATKSFYTNARWLVLAAILKRLKPEGGEALALSEGEKAAVSAAAIDYAERLLTQAVTKGFASYEAAPGGMQVLIAPRDFQSVFKSQADCRTLFDALKAEIWKESADAGETATQGGT
jgi:hypothetical protein